MTLHSKIILQSYKITGQVYAWIFANLMILLISKMVEHYIKK